MSVDGVEVDLTVGDSESSGEVRYRELPSEDQ